MIVRQGVSSLRTSPYVLHTRERIRPRKVRLPRNITVCSTYERKDPSSQSQAAPPRKITVCSTYERKDPSSQSAPSSEHHGMFYIREKGSILAKSSSAFLGKSPYVLHTRERIRPRKVRLPRNITVCSTYERKDPSSQSQAAPSSENHCMFYIREKGSVLAKCAFLGTSGDHPHVYRA
jgi:hypothetical protein